MILNVVISHPTSVPPLLLPLLLFFSFCRRVSPFRCPDVGLKTPEEGGVFL